MLFKKKVRGPLWLLVMTLTCNAYAQTSLPDNGIKWIKGLTWEQVKQKAKKENKYIFVDCYATWCIPCREMDKDIYVNDTVGSLMNDKYVSVKLQIDTSRNDNDEVKAWYNIGHQFVQDYDITGFPTFLFFSPEAEIVHKELGSKNLMEFVALATNALKEDRQIYTLIKKYKTGKLEHDKMKDLSVLLKRLGDEALSTQLANDYIHGYLDKLSLGELATKENLDFINSNSKLISSDDKVFDIYYNHPELVDSISKSPGWGTRFSDALICKEYIFPELDKARLEGTDPNWRKVFSTIQRRYSQNVAQRLIIKSKYDWYSEKKDWLQAIKYGIKKIELNGLDTVGLNVVFGSYPILTHIYLHTDNKRKLQKALDWIEQIDRAAKNAGDTMLRIGLKDTYAGLLYKTGRRQEGIATMESYLSIFTNRRTNSLAIKLDTILSAMKEGKKLDEVLSQIE